MNDPSFETHASEMILSGPVFANISVEGCDSGDSTPDTGSVSHLVSYRSLLTMLTAMTQFGPDF